MMEIETKQWIQSSLKTETEQRVSTNIKQDEAMLTVLIIYETEEKHHVSS